jgi:beta-glucosidase
MYMKKNIFLFCLFLVCLQFAGCSDSYKYPFLNPKLSSAERAKDVVARLTLEEKVSQMLNTTPAIERLGIPPYDWWNEALHGVARTEYKVTVFPQAIAMAATWNVDAMLQMGDYTAEEARAVYNLSQAKHIYSDYHGLTFWSPNINIFRDPRWGRGQETFGEDPFLTGSIGSGFVRGLQGSDPVALKAAACAKHYAVHSGPEPLRHVFDISVSNYDLWDTYLPAFKTLVTEAKVAGVMCAYNAYDKQPCCGSDKLMLDILRNDWKFTGYVTSDCGAIDDFYNHHKTHPDAPHAAADAVFHGTDVDCGQSAYKGLIQAVKDGLITETQIDISLQRLFEIRFRLGLFDPKSKSSLNKIDSSALCKKEHRDLSLKMAQQSVVLLKNDGILPLDKTKLKKVAIVGPNIDREEVQLGNYNGFPLHIYTPLEALKTKLDGVELIVTEGCNYTERRYAHNLNIARHAENIAVEFYNNRQLEGEPVYKGVSDKLQFSSGGSSNPVADGVQLKNYSSRITGAFTAPLSGEIELHVGYDDAYRLFIDDNLVGEDWKGETSRTARLPFNVVEGKKYNFRLEHFQGDNGGGWISLDAYKVEEPTFAETAAKVKDADAIIFIGGISPRLEGEEMRVNAVGFNGGDRTSIMLPKVQTELMQALKATGKPVVFVMMTGSAIAVPWEADNVNAIVNAWYGGEFAGNAIADVLLGDCNPSGRLPVTFYAADADLPDFEDYTMTNRTYKYFTGKPLYPFGYGLSYTDFACNWATQPSSAYSAADTIKCKLTVKNTGVRSGDEVVQVYVKYPQGQGFPLKELRWFDRVSLDAAQSADLEVAIPVAQLAKWNDEYGKLDVPRGAYSIFVGGDSESETLTATFEVK